MLLQMNYKKNIHDKATFHFGWKEGKIILGQLTVPK